MAECLRTNEILIDFGLVELWVISSCCKILSHFSWSWEVEFILRTRNVKKA